MKKYKGSKKNIVHIGGLSPDQMRRRTAQDKKKQEKDAQRQRKKEKEAKEMSAKLANEAKDKLEQRNKEKEAKEKEAKEKEAKEKEAKEKEAKEKSAQLLATEAKDKLEQQNMKNADEDASLHTPVRPVVVGPPFDMLGLDGEKKANDKANRKKEDEANMRLGDQIEELENAQQKTNDNDRRKKEQQPPKPPRRPLDLPNVPTTPVNIPKKVTIDPTKNTTRIFNNDSDSDSASASTSDSNKIVGSEIQQPKTIDQGTGKSCDDIIVRINDNKYTNDIKQIDLSIFVPSKDSRVIIRNYANNTEAELVNGLSDFSEVNTHNPYSTNNINNNNNNNNNSSSNGDSNNKHLLTKDNLQAQQVDINKKKVMTELIKQKETNNDTKLDSNFSKPNEF